MKVYLLGDPNPRLFAPQGKNWKGSGGTDRWAWRFTFKGCSPSDVGGGPYIAHVNSKVRDHSDYGGLIKRSVLIHPVDTYRDDWPKWRWEDLLQPITAVEAWLACVKAKMTINGIQVCYGPDKYYRVYEDVPGRVIIQVSVKGEIKDLNARDEQKFASAEWARGDCLFARATCRSSKFDMPLTRMLLATDRVVELGLGNRHGWEIAPVWRLEGDALERQAHALDYEKGTHLLGRIERRNKALDKARKEGRR